MYLDNLTTKLIKIIPKSVRRQLGYSKIGSRIVLKLKNNDLGKVVELENGIKIRTDIFSTRELELGSGKDSEEKIKKVFLQNIEEGDLVIDCGAKIGEYTLIASKKIKDSGKIFAFEPFKESALKLKNNLELNNFKNCQIIEMAISNFKGKAIFYENSLSGEGCLDSNLIRKCTSKTEINLETIDNFIKTNKIEKVNMMKIDVEGYELEVFEGAKNSLKENKIEKIICEVHDIFLKKKRHQ